jgi:hypothetical protein
MGASLDPLPGAIKAAPEPTRDPDGSDAGHRDDVPAIKGAIRIVPMSAVEMRIA